MTTRAAVAVHSVLVLAQKPHSQEDVERLNVRQHHEPVTGGHRRLNAQRQEPVRNKSQLLDSAVDRHQHHRPAAAAAADGRRGDSRHGDSVVDNVRQADVDKAAAAVKVEELARQDGGNVAGAGGARGVLVDRPVDARNERQEKQDSVKSTVHTANSLPPAPRVKQADAALL